MAGTGLLGPFGTLVVSVQEKKIDDPKKNNLETFIFSR